MVRQDAGETPGDLDRLASSSDAARNGWQRTIEDTRAMAADREEHGYETVVLLSDDTSPIAPASDRDHWGLTYLVSGSDREAFRDARARAEFDETAVYQASQEGNTFLVTECLDHDAELVVFLAGVFRMEHAVELVRAALDRGEMYSHVRKLNGEVAGSIRHEDAEAFFPDPDAYYSYEPTEFVDTVGDGNEEA